MTLGTMLNPEFQKAAIARYGEEMGAQLKNRKYLYLIFNIRVEVFARFLTTNLVLSNVTS